MKAHLNYLKYVMRHKWYVFLACLDMGVPLLIAIFHDWDKFLPDEWFPYVHTFYAPDGSKQYRESAAFARAWMLHQHRNKHHWQYWIWISIPSHNAAAPLPKTDYLMWDRGELQRVVTRNSGPNEWIELLPPSPSDHLGGCDPMPDVYRREMVADWIGAGKALGFPNTWEWYEKNKSNIKLHRETREWVEKEMSSLEQRYSLNVPV
jgi:hypothetical protein